MPFSRPALPDLISRCQQRIWAALPGTDPQLLRSVSGAVGAVLGQELNLEYGYLDYIFEQFYVRTATGQYLDDRGNPYGIPRQQATIAGGSVGSPAGGGIPTTPIPVGTLMQTSDGSVIVSVATATAVAGDGSVTAAVITTIPGAAGNLAAGTALQLITAIAGVPAGFTVNAQGSGNPPAGLTGGSDQEQDDAYKVRILARMQQPPQGGANRDYIAWTKNAVAGVSRVWVFPLLQGLGSVGVASVFDGRGTGAAIIPTTEDLVALQAAIAPGPIAPVCATSIAFALAVDLIPVVIGNLVPTTGFTQAQALANAVASLTTLFALSTPGGASAGDGVAGTNAAPISGKTFLEDISDAITQSEGVGSFDLVTPAADVVSAYGHLAQLGAVTTQ